MSSPLVPRWLFDAAQEFDSRTRGVAIGFAGSAYVAGWQDREASLRYEPVAEVDREQRHEYAQKVHAARPGVPTNHALAAIEVLLMLGWRPTRVADTAQDPAAGTEAERAADEGADPDMIAIQDWDAAERDADDTLPGSDPMCD